MEQTDTGQEAASKEIYTGIFAPVLLGFVEWVLQEAESRGIHRLYFLARDGYQMYLAAAFLCEKRKLDLDCRYLYGSRYAWRMPQFALMGEGCLDMLCRGGIDVTFEKVMRRGGLTGEESEAVAEELGFVQNYRKILSYSEVMQLKKPLADSRLFLPFVYEHSRAAYENTMGYFRQEGLLEDVRYALVDSGWTGSLQQTLAQLLHHAGYEKQPEGFYFGLYELPPGVPEDSYHTYYFGPGYGLRKKVYFSNCLYEAVYSAPHGMTAGYERHAEVVETVPANVIYQPVFYNRNNLNQVRMEQEKAWLKEYLESWHEDGGKAKTIKVTSAQRGKQTYKRLKRFMGTPTAMEAEIYGSLLFSDDVTEEHTQPVAAKLSKTEIKSQYVWNRVLIMLGIKKQVLKDSAWIEGSVSMADGCRWWQLWNVRCYKYLVYFRKWIKRGLEH